MPPRRSVATVRTLLRGMHGRRTNLALMALLVGATITGTALFALGGGWALAALIAHGVIALGVVVTTRWKWRIVRRGTAARPVRSTWPSVVLGVLVIVTVLSGVLHSTGIVLRYGPVDDMQVHVIAALATIGVAGWHVAARGTVPQRQDLTRRNLLRGGLVLAVAAAGFATLEGVTRLARLPGGRRRFTGSYEQGSHNPASMPAIIWLRDPPLHIAAEQWRLRVSDARGDRTLRLDDVTAYDDRRTAIIDCTSGWFAEQRWRGVRLTRLLEVGADARSVVVRSATGYDRRFPIDDLDQLLLATGYGDQALAARHGFPARLVAPGRRGFWWVKWVVAIEVSDRPWWVQPYFPLQ